MENVAGGWGAGIGSDGGIANGSIPSARSRSSISTSAGLAASFGICTTHIVPGFPVGASRSGRAPNGSGGQDLFDDEQVEPMLAVVGRDPADHL